MNTSEIEQAAKLITARKRIEECLGKLQPGSDTRVRIGAGVGKDVVVPDDIGRAVLALALSLITKRLEVLGITEF